MKNRQRNHSKRVRRGVTLVELIVALTILSIGLLGIVGVSGGIARSLGEARSDGLAATYAQARFEKLAGTQCSTLTKASVIQVVTRNVTERYIVNDSTNATIAITDSVSWTTRRGTRRQTFKSLLPCRPGA